MSYPEKLNKKKNSFGDDWVLDLFCWLTGFNCYLPLSRVKKILKTDPKVRGMITWKISQKILVIRKLLMDMINMIFQISRDAPALFSKACEYLILELTLRAWMHSIMHSSDHTALWCLPCRKKFRNSLFPDRSCSIWTILRHASQHQVSNLTWWIKKKSYSIVYILH